MHARHCFTNCLDFCGLSKLNYAFADIAKAKGRIVDKATIATWILMHDCTTKHDIALFLVCYSHVNVNVSVGPLLLAGHCHHLFSVLRMLHP